MGLPQPLLSYLFSILILLSPALSYDSVSYSKSSAVRIDSSRTVLAGPLTTVFTPPASCFTPHTVAYYGYPRIIQGFEGPNGDECSPENWKYDRYFSPGQCPSGYKACTLPTETQRLVTTEICCPSGFDCVGQDLCSKTFSTPTHVTYTDSSVSTENTQRILGIKATPIQIRFEASDSTAVPIPTESFKLPEYTPPKKELSKREKAAIVAGSIASAVLLSLGAYFGWKHWKQRKYNSVSPSFPLDDDPPPPYTK